MGLLVAEGIHCTVFIYLVSVDLSLVTVLLIMHFGMQDAFMHAQLIHTSLTILITNPCGK